MREIVSTDHGPKAIGPYSQGVKANGFVFISGQIALNPATGQLVEGGIAQQTERVLENLRGIVEMNEVYARFFPSAPPARSTVEVARLPKDVRIEIDLIALA